MPLALFLAVEATLPVGVSCRLTNFFPTSVTLVLPALTFRSCSAVLNIVSTPGWPVFSLNQPSLARPLPLESIERHESACRMEDDI